jgi:adenine-specific DNA methylase
MINKSVREKSIRHGHPSTVHQWRWARRPLAACRAVLFARLVEDASAYQCMPTWASGLANCRPGYSNGLEVDDIISSEAVPAHRPATLSQLSQLAP